MERFRELSYKIQPMVPRPCIFICFFASPTNRTVGGKDLFFFNFRKGKRRARCARARPAATVATFVFSVGLGQNDFALISSRVFVLDASSMTSQWMACIQDGYIHLKGVPCLLPTLLAHNPQEGHNPLAGITCPPDSGVFMKCEGCVNGLLEQGIFF